VGIGKMHSEQELAFAAYSALLIAEVEAKVTGEPSSIKVGQYTLGTIDKVGYVELKIRGGNIDERA
jgi:hypothetical protein